jgi:membrane associated rhomboid family serine protease
MRPLAEESRGDEEPDARPPRVEIRADARKQRILEESLVLSSQRIRHWIEYDHGSGREGERERYLLTLNAEDAPRALEALRLYEQENRGFRPDAGPVGAFDLHLSPLLHLAIPASVFFWAASVPWEPWITGRGGANAGKILNGEFWRTVTATTLHADTEHFLGNMLSGFFILNLLRRRCGPGTSMPLLTLAAAVTNYVVAATSIPERFSIGFSTVVFAALGLLAGLETLFLPSDPERRKAGLRGISPLLAAFFLAVMTGLGENADIKAHFIGFAAGAACSPLAYGIRRTSWEKWGWQVAGVLGTLGVYAAAWWRALA